MKTLQTFFIFIAVTALTACGRPEAPAIPAAAPAPIDATIPTPPTRSGTAPDMSRYNACVSSVCSSARPADPRSMAACYAAYSSCQK